MLPQPLLRVNPQSQIPDLKKARINKTISAAKQTLTCAVALRPYGPTCGYSPFNYRIFGSLLCTDFVNSDQNRARLLGIKKLEEVSRLPPT